MRLRALVMVLTLTAAVYLLWRWSVAGSHQVTAIVSGVALVPLFIVVVALTVRQVATTLGWAARQPRQRVRTGRPHAARLRRRSRSAATNMVSGGHDEPSPGGVSSSSSSAKIAA